MDRSEPAKIIVLGMFLVIKIIIQMNPIRAFLMDQAPSALDRETGLSLLMQLLKLVV